MNHAQYEIDELDREILSILLDDARTAFLEIGRRLSVAGATVHQRVDKMKAAGIITGSKITVAPERLGLGVTVLIGIHVRSARAIPDVVEQLRGFDEVLEAYYTTGNYALIVKIRTADIKAYHRFLVGRLQAIDAIGTTESFICLDQPIDRDIAIEESRLEA